MSLQSKGQTFSMDFMIACSVFILAFAILYIYWAYSSRELSETKDINDMIDTAYLISQAWFREGTPEYWDSSNVMDLGLANDHRFNWTKMIIMRDDLEYVKTKELLGAGIYDYNFTVYNTTNDAIYYSGSYPSDPDNLVKIKRIGILNGKIVRVEVMVWK